MQSKPTHTTSFEAKIRTEWVFVEAAAWADQDGIYRQEITGVYLDGVNVTGLLTDADLGMLDSIIDGALQADADSDNGFDSNRDAFQLGE
jgi:hypothetical protein